MVEDCLFLFVNHKSDINYLSIYMLVYNDDCDNDQDTSFQCLFLFFFIIHIMIVCTTVKLNSIATTPVPDNGLKVIIVDVEINVVITVQRIRLFCYKARFSPMSQ